MLFSPTLATYGDKLTAFGGDSISYDSYGRTTYYRGKAITYYEYDFNRIQSIGGISFTYDADGMRKSKTVGGVTHTYYYDGLNLIREEWGNNTIVFLYDASGSPIGMQHRTTSDAAGDWDTYYYEKNLQGDIIAVYNATGTKLVTYDYDAWGDISYTTYYNGGVSTSVVNNPLRYRGYYYDDDLDLYYLTTRYYDPETCRFVTADDPAYLGANGDLVSYNLYAYCSNNPVMYTDFTGEFPWHIVIGAAIGGIVGGISAALSGGDEYDVAFGVLSGMLSGALTASGVGVTGQVLGSATISMGFNAADQIKNIVADDTGETTFDVGDMLFDGAVAAVAAGFGGNGASYGNSGGINASWNQLFKKGLSNSNARAYFYKTAHNSGKEFVLTSLAKSSLKNAVGTAIITAKNYFRGAIGC